MSKESFISNRERVGRGGVHIPEALNVDAISSKTDLIGLFRDFWNLNGYQIRNDGGGLAFISGQQTEFKNTIAIPTDPKTGNDYQIISEYYPHQEDIEYWVPYQTSLKQGRSNGHECHRLVKTPGSTAGPLIDVIKIDYWHVVDAAPHRTCDVSFEGYHLGTEGYTKDGYEQEIANISKFFVEALF